MPFEEQFVSVKSFFDLLPGSENVHFDAGQHTPLNVKC